MRRPELVIFDLAGTTVRDNKDVHRCLIGAMDKLSVSVSVEEVNDVMGIPKPVAIKSLLQLKSYPSISQGVVQKIHEHFVELMTGFYRYDPTVSEKDGASVLFRALKHAGIIVGVNTGFDRQVTQPLLERLGWQRLGLLDFTITSDEVERGRPYPDMILEIMRRSGVTDPLHVAKIGDTLADLEEGKAAGCGWNIAVTSGAGEKSQLEAHGPTHLVESLHELSEIFLLRPKEA